MEGGTKPSATASPWLNAFFDPLAGLKTVASCVRLSDLNGDGDSKLCVCDFDQKLKVYKGTSLFAEYALLDVPVAMCAVYTELSSVSIPPFLFLPSPSSILVTTSRFFFIFCVDQPRLPCIAVAAGSHVFIYRQLRPYRKWSCPPIDIPQVEVDIWTDLKSGNIDDKMALKLLMEARESGVQLTSRSTELLSFESNHTARANFINEMKGVQYFQQTLITCMEPLKKDSEEVDALTLIVVGTEAGQVMILPLDPNNSAFLCKITLPSTPVLMSVSGLYDVEWRVSLACRDGKLYTIKSGDVRGSAVLVGGATDLGAQAVAMVRQDKSLWIATMDKLVSCYTTRGKRIKAMVMPDEITELCILPAKRSKVGYLLMVALASGVLRMYKESQLVNTVELEKPIIALRFGSYGREDGTLICIHGQGSLTIKIWRRQVDVDAMTADAGPPPEQDIPLPVPKKTKLYVEQTQRERDNAAEIHRAFQRDLCRLRLDTARAYVKTLSEGHAMVHLHMNTLLLM